MAFFCRFPGMERFACLCSFLLLGGLWGLPAQAPQFELLTVADGLTTSVCTSVLRDSRAYVWIGTQSGLQRYDGYTMRTYAEDKKNPHGLRSGAIKSLLEDPSGDLWVATAKGGLSRYLRQADHFITYTPQDSPRSGFPFWGINRLKRDRAGRIWVTSPQGLLRFTSSDKPTFERYPSDDSDSTRLWEGQVTAWGQDSSGGIWVSVADKGLCWLPPDQVARAAAGAAWCRFPFHQAAGFSLASAEELLTLPNGDLWIGTTKGAISLSPGYELADTLPPTLLGMPFASYQAYPPQTFGPYHQNRSIIYQMALDADQTLWLMGAHGLYRWFPEADTFAWYNLTDLGIRSQGFNMLMELFIDPHGLMWISTVEGLARPADRDPAFERLQLPRQEEATLVRAVLEDRHGQRWMGVENGGIWVFDQTGTPYQHIQLKAPRMGLNYDFIMALMEDQAGHIWVGTFGGGYFELTPRRAASGQVTGYTQRAFLPTWEASDPGDYYVYSLLEDRRGRLWVGGFGGLSYHDRAAGKARRYPCPVANCVVEDREGRIWVGTDGGLYQLDDSTDRLSPYVPGGDSLLLGHNRIESLAQGPDGRLWIGTLRGLKALDLATDSVESYGIDAGLSHLHVRSILIDATQQLWVATLNGLHRWTGEAFFAYRQSQGTFNDQFINRAAAVSPSGKLSFGGNRGILTFDPQALRPPAPIPQVRLTGLQVLNQQLGPGDETPEGFSLTAPIDELTALRLTHQERMVTFEFAALGYRQVADYRYEYLLEGFDEAWHSQPANHRQATYTNLPAGDYRLRVRAWDTFGQMSQQEVNLPLRVDPPWWLSLPAYLAYGLLTLALVAGLFRLRGQALRREWAVALRIEEAKAEEREQVRARSARDFHDEAGSYLTKLSLYTGLLRQQVDAPQVDGTIAKLEENIRGLSTGMRDFIWVLDSRRDRLSETLIRIRSFGEQLFEHSQIRFRYREAVTAGDQVRLPMAVRRHLLLILKEAMNNALKYAQASEVRLEVTEEEEGTLHLTLTDDGIGFAEEQLSRINGLTNMESRAEEMGADFHLEATPGMGTTIRLSWPIHPNG
jgi:ligand-binding sensor domain-containing protein/signal transduction histidine kinase